MVIARKTLKMLKKTTWGTLNSVLALWGFKENIHFHMNNVDGVMTFWNDSQISMLELAPSNVDPDYNSLGSLEITGAFIDEVSEICSKAVKVLASRMRWKVHETFIVPKMLMSTNPCLTWVRSRFVQDDNEDPVKLAAGNMQKLMEVLQTIRNEYGKSIIVTCGYRCETLNKALKGATNSDHKFGAAADFRTVSDSIQDNKVLFELVVKMAKNGAIQCRQIIDEYNYNWVHVSVNHKDNKLKSNEVLHIK
jgi:hypothetical protein